jgi:stearoyl-CoA desaturase (delta-9 desaturase)
MITGTQKYILLVFTTLLAFVYSLYYVISTDSWSLFWGMVIYFQVIKILGNNIAMHRFFSHKSFTTGPLREKFLTYITILLSVRSPISYSLVHRHHHKHSDTEKDIHSPYINGFIPNLFGLWEYNGPNYFVEKGCTMGVRDLLRNKDLVFIDKYYFTIWSMLIVLSLLISWKITVFFLLAPAGYYHLSAGFMNTLSHWRIPGSYRNYTTNDHSQNHLLWEFVSCGEGFHNNHHQDPNNYNFGKRWFEIDLSALVIKLFFDNKHLGQKS